jgi:hypothetical protein
MVVTDRGSQFAGREVISASRRTDLPMRFPRWLAQAIREGRADVPQPYSGMLRPVSLMPEDVHTMVLWSKDFAPLLADEGGVRQALARYDQVFCHLTVTGLGGGPLEPKIRPWTQVTRQLPELIEFAGDPRRVTVRFDPIIHWRDGGGISSNFSLGTDILRMCAAYGVQNVRISFATLYEKVRRRKGWDWYDPSRGDRQRMVRELVAQAAPLGITIYSCGDNDLQAAGALPSRCIDGELLTRLHPRGLAARGGKDNGQRRECGCTPSVDIGSYTMRCPNGCRYCYANPLIS